jgi:hypothetical protein
LKPDDGTSRRFSEHETGLEGGRPRLPQPEVSSSELQPYPYPFQRPPIAPRDTLVHPGGRQPGSSHMPLAATPIGIYASASVSSSFATASGTTYNPVSQRPPSSSSSLISSQPPSPYYQTPSAGTSPEGPLPRGYTGGYRGQPTAQEFYPPSTGPYSVSLFPRPASRQQPPFELPPSPYAPQQSIAPELQLPPIRPAPEGAYTNPAMAQQQQRQAQQQQERDSRMQGQAGGNGATRQPDPKRPRMSVKSIVNPRND